MSVIGTKRTYRVALHMSAFGGKADTGSGHSACPAITCAYTDRWLRCPKLRIWDHRARRSHTPKKLILHRLRSERCLYRSRRAKPQPERGLPSDRRLPQDRAGQRALAGPVRRKDQQALLRLRDPEGVVRLLLMSISCSIFASPMAISRPEANALPYGAKTGWHRFVSCSEALSPD